MTGNLNPMQKIDLHTHVPKSNSSIQILNAFAQDLPIADDQNLYSAGLHPWHLARVNPEECLDLLARAMTQKNMVAMGECGLDRFTPADFAIQEWYFKKQIKIAQEHSKPLIIHCVRAFSELIRLKKEFKTTIPWIIHGYQANVQTTLQLARHHFYFSLGESMLSHPLKKEFVQFIPSDHLFLETDNSEISIDQIYSLAAQELKMDVQTLVGIVFENFHRLFGNPRN